MNNRMYSDDELLSRLKTILLEHGEDLTKYEYDDLESRPMSSRNLGRRFGSWSEAKSKALGGSREDISKDYLVRQNERLLDRLDKERDRNQVVIDACLAAASKIQVKPVPFPSAEQNGKLNNLDFHAIRSDAHVGEDTDAASVQNVASYNVKQYDKRLDRWLEKIMLFKEQDGSSHGLNKLVINFLGDQVTGERIFNGQSYNIDLPLVDQLFHSLEKESQAILSLAKEFNEVEVFCVIGNHGRPGRKGDHHKRTNFDYIFYRILQMMLEPQKNVKVFVSESPSMLIKHGNYHFLLNHGDNARGWAGIPYYGLERMFRRLPGLYGMVVDIELVAHHHQPANISDSIIMNGAFPGGSDLSVNKMGVASIPTQKIFYFHPVWGINRETNLKLADPPELVANEHGIYTSYTGPGGVE